MLNAPLLFALTIVFIFQSQPPSSSTNGRLAYQTKKLNSRPLLARLVIAQIPNTLALPALPTQHLER